MAVQAQASTAAGDPDVGQGRAQARRVAREEGVTTPRADVATGPNPLP